MVTLWLKLLDFKYQTMVVKSFFKANFIHLFTSWANVIYSSSMIFMITLHILSSYCNIFIT